jgi:peptide/nickel transport system substrate-binding protein
VPNYWRGAQYPKIKKILFRFIANTSTRINQLRAGEIHVVALIPWDKVRELKDVPAIRLNRVLGNGYEHVTLNEQKFAPFADVRVRRALAHAIDRETIVKTILEDEVTIVNGPIQPLSWAYESNVPTYNYDPAKAKSLLDDAGWKVGATGVRERTACRSRSPSSRRPASRLEKTSRRRFRNSSRTSAST